MDRCVTMMEMWMYMSGDMCMCSRARSSHGSL